MKLDQLISELRSRGVYRVAAIYSAAAWALLQVADVIFPIVGLPDWSVTAVLVAGALGFPVAVIVSWFFDLTPEGLVEAPPVATGNGRIKLSTGHVIQFVLIIMLTALVGYLYLDRLSDRPADTATATAGEKTEGPSIAVMPFVNMSEVPQMEYLGDGLAEEILNLLAKLSEIHVAARTSSFYFKDKAVDIRTVGRQLNVSHVLEGSVRRDGEQVRVTAQLIDISNGYHIWSETYDAELGNMLELQDEIARKVANHLQVLLSPQSREVLAQSADVDPASYDYYLRGRAYLRMPKDPANLQYAREFFEKAAAVDSDFADAYAGLCDSMLGLYELDLDVEKFHEAEAACQHALVIDRRAGSVYVALGNLYRTSGQYEQAIREFNTAISLSNTPADAYLGLGSTYLLANQSSLAEEAYAKAIELQPNYWKAHMGMGNYLYETGRTEEAIPYYKRITELIPQSETALNNLGAALFLSGQFDQAARYWEESLQLAPSSTTYSNVATSRYFAGRYAEAVELYHKAVEYAPDDCELWGNLGDAYSQLPGDTDLAVPMYKNAIKLAAQRLEINPSDADTLAMMAHYQAMVGEGAEALAAVEKALALAPENMIVNYNAAVTLANLGDEARALDLLEQSLKLGYPWHIANADANLRRLRNTPRYAALTAKEP